MVLAFEVTVMLLLVESIHPAESFTNKRTEFTPVVLRKSVALALPMMVSLYFTPFTFHQYLAKLLLLPVEVLLADTMVGKPQVCEVENEKEGVI